MIYGRTPTTVKKCLRYKRDAFFKHFQLLEHVWKFRNAPLKGRTHCRRFIDRVDVMIYGIDENYTRASPTESN